MASKRAATLSSAEISAQYHELKEWLRGLDNRPDFFTKHPPHCLEVLHEALEVAIIEITQNLDRRLEYGAHAAQEDEHNIQLKEGDFDQDRMFDVEELAEGGLQAIQLLSRQALVKYLVLVKDEIAWLQNEIRRLEVHCDIAKNLIKLKDRSSFEYTPTPRRKRGPSDWDIGDVGDEFYVSQKEVKVEDSDEEMLEDSDEEMLEDGDVDEGGTAVRHDSIAAQGGSWGNLHIKC